MGESLKGFISVELFFLKMWLTMPKIHGKKWSNSLDHHHWITLILNHFSNSFGIFFFSETKEILCPKLHIKRIYSTPKKPKTIIKIIWWWEEKWGFAEAEVFTPKWLRNGSWTSSFDCWHDIIVKCTWKAIKEENKVKPRNIIKQQGKTYWVI